MFYSINHDTKSGAFYLVDDEYKDIFLFYSIERSIITASQLIDFLINFYKSENSNRIEYNLFLLWKYLKSSFKTHENVYYDICDYYQEYKIGFEKYLVLI
jgi:hypothetical protein